MLRSVSDFEPSETAVIDVMLLRGPQTLGELRTRTERLYDFSNLGEVQETLDGLIRRDDPLVIRLPIQPGQKEARFAHLLAGEIDVDALTAAQALRPVRGGGDNQAIEKLVREVPGCAQANAQVPATFYRVH